MPPVTSCLGCGTDIPLGASRCEACRVRKPSIAAYRQYRNARSAVLEGATVCWLCGKPPRPDDPLEVDHVVPRARGGGHDRANLLPGHRSCNNRKGAGTWTPPGIRVL